MNDLQAAQVLLALRAAYPSTEVTEEMAQLWVNALASTDETVGIAAAGRWIETENRWPTIAQFNSYVTAIRREQRDETGSAQPVYQHQRTRAIRCDGSGWFDRGKGLEACPTCNEWNRTLIENGDFHDGRGKAPGNWVRDESCSRWGQAAVEGDVVTSASRASAIMLRALTEQLEEDGYVGSEIEAALNRRSKLIASMARLADRAGSST